ncbi:hypothetical protein [Geomonas sp.]|uniref:hypothetical protein n=1 Tax=Geomonas sp. TaxID=2651584 RepID=UPI002B46309A|nr:hypothetical protein [Geomonas sp.]HJV33776.1 hypothetical protein [Geomonas sp.]
MRGRFSNLKIRYDVIGAIILVAGLLGALCIFLGADDFVDPAGADLEESRKYLHVLESYGGKASAVAQEIMLWFAGLWHGKNLAFTIAVLAIVVSFWFFFVDYFSDADDDSERGKPRLPGKPRHH